MESSVPNPYRVADRFIEETTSLELTALAAKILSDRYHYSDEEIEDILSAHEEDDIKTIIWDSIVTSLEVGP